MMSAKKATTGFLKIEVFWYKGYDVIICFDDVIKKFGNCSISMKSYQNLNLIKITTEKPLFCGIVIVQVQ